MENTISVPLWMDQINADGWIKHADYAWTSHNEPFVQRHADESDGRLKIFRNKSDIGSSGVIFLGTCQEIRKCLAEIPRDGNYIFITRDQDHILDQKLFEAFPPSIKHWFAMYCDVDHPIITHIPIGLATINGFNNTLQRSCEGKDTVQSISTGRRIFSRVNTNPETYDRNNCLAVNKDNPLFHIVYDQMPSDEFYARIKGHEFTLSLAGLGPGTNRTYEAMCLGSIPIVSDHKCNRYFEDMPIAFCPKDFVITNEWLNLQAEQIKGKSTERARMSYWDKVFTEIKNNIL